MHQYKEKKIRAMQGDTTWYGGNLINDQTTPWRDSPEATWDASVVTRGKVWAGSFTILTIIISPKVLLKVRATPPGNRINQRSTLIAKLI